MANTDYTYLYRVKNLLKFTPNVAGTDYNSKTDDPMISDYITAASQAWNELTSQTWYEQSKQFLYTARDGDIIVSRDGYATVRLDVPLINSVSSINWQYDKGTTWNSTLTSTNWEYKSLNDGSRLSVWGPDDWSDEWARNHLKLQVTADLGYPLITITPPDMNPVTYTNVPMDIQFAVGYMAAYGYSVIRTHSDGVLASTEWGSVKIGDMEPGYIQSTINRYTSGLRRV